jgi:hypothetical protein
MASPTRKAILAQPTWRARRPIGLRMGEEAAIDQVDLANRLSVSPHGRLPLFDSEAPVASLRY